MEEKKLIEAQFLANIHRQLKRLSDSGITVSIVCGEYKGSKNYFYSVDVEVFLKDLPDSFSFEEPYAANSIPHAIEIAEIECKKRGWYI